MNPIIVYVDDASYALPLVQALAASPQAQASHWLLVACAPSSLRQVLSVFEQQGFGKAAVVGRVEARGAAPLVVQGTTRRCATPA